MSALSAKTLWKIFVLSKPVEDQPLFLASVTSADEAELCLSGGADIIDAKDPRAGALGALAHDHVRAIVRRVGGRLPVSATIGDLPPDPRQLADAATVMAAAGVDIVKIGFFGDDDPQPAIVALGQVNLGSAKLVAVIMADRDPDFSLIPLFAANDFLGVMLDTADKSNGALTDALTPARIADFVSLVHGQGLIAGLAGSLRLEHVAPLAALQADILGFRGALCERDRTAALDVAKLRSVRAALDHVSLIKRPAAIRRPAASGRPAA